MRRGSSETFCDVILMRARTCSFDPRVGAFPETTTVSLARQTAQPPLTRIDAGMHALERMHGPCSGRQHRNASLVPLFCRSRPAVRFDRMRHHRHTTPPLPQVLPHAVRTRGSLPYQQGVEGARQALVHLARAPSVALPPQRRCHTPPSLKNAHEMTQPPPLSVRPGLMRSSRRKRCLLPISTWKRRRSSSTSARRSTPRRSLQAARRRRVRLKFLCPSRLIRRTALIASAAVCPAGYAR